MHTKMEIIQRSKFIGLLKIVKTINPESEEKPVYEHMPAKIMLYTMKFYI